ncbi:hypothetical protein ACTFR8_22270 [Bacillus cereus group sp. MYBK15-3]|uniref:hypothetical protein n=1 Tax=Bacillus cereus group TaxID=86661 RepID=UPI001C8BE223|nr:hypothetical protein [Bacillus cereus]MBX9158327.1 hypothetical protein [Bacillus cereus]
MSRFVETMFGMLIFAAFIVVFCIQAWIGVMGSQQFTQRTTEMTNIVRENGGLGAEAKAYGNQLKQSGISYSISGDTGQNTGKTLTINYTGKLKFQSGFKSTMKLERQDQVFITKRK